MTGLEIGLLVLGILIFIGSFFFTEKLSSSDIDTIKKMSKNDINILLDEHLKDASSKIDQIMETRFTDTMNRFDRETNKRTTDEIYSISEHGDTVRETIDSKIQELNNQFEALEKSRKEIVFLHNMLSDKQEKVTDLEKEAQKLQSSLHNMKRSVEDAIERLSIEQQIEVVSHSASASQLRDGKSLSASTEQSESTSGMTPRRIDSADPTDLLLEQIDRNTNTVEQEIEILSSTETQQASMMGNSTVMGNSAVMGNGTAMGEVSGIRKPAPSAISIAKPGNINERILTMHREGYSDVDIARRLDKGLGEIRLVLGLFDEGEA